MSGGLNLIPNPGVVAVVGAAFLLAMQIVKIYFLQPFLALQGKRRAVTSGGKGQAEERLRQVAAKEQELAAKLRAAREAAGAARDQIVSDTKKVAREKITAAKSETELQLQGARKQITEQFQQESSKIQQHMSKLVDAAHSAIVHG